MANQRRVFRVAERIRELISNQLVRAGDPRFALVSITSVVISRDLRHAKVYWQVTGGADRVPEVQEAFDTAGGLFRRVLANDLDARFVPDLKFYYDDTLDTQERVLKLLDSIKQE